MEDIIMEGNLIDPAPTSKNPPFAGKAPDLDHDRDEEQPPSPTDSFQTYFSRGSSAVVSPPGRIARPPSASHRQSPRIATGSRSSSAGRSTLPDDQIEGSSSIAARTAPPSEGSIARQDDESSPGGASGIQSPWSSSSRAEEHIVKAGQPETENSLDLSAYETLRRDYAQIQESFKMLERQCNSQEQDLKKYREEHSLAEKAAEDHHRDMAELKRKKAAADKGLAEANTHIGSLEKRITGLQSLEPVQKELEASEKNERELFNKNEAQENENKRLHLEVDELKASEISQKAALKESEARRTEMDQEIKALLEILEKAHNDMIKRDEQDFRQCDEEFLELLAKQNDKRPRDSIQTTEANPEHLADVVSSPVSSSIYSMRSRPTSMNSQSPAIDAIGELLTSDAPTVGDAIRNRGKRQALITTKSEQLPASSLDPADYEEEKKDAEATGVSSALDLNLRSPTRRPVPAWRIKQREEMFRTESLSESENEKTEKAIRNKVIESLEDEQRRLHAMIAPPFPGTRTSERMSQQRARRERQQADQVRPRSQKPKTPETSERSGSWILISRLIGPIVLACVLHHLAKPYSVIHPPVYQTSPPKTMTLTDTVTSFLPPTETFTMTATRVEMAAPITVTVTETKTPSPAAAPRAVLGAARGVKNGARVAGAAEGSRRPYLGRSYWGWAPRLQRWIDIVSFDFSEIVLGGQWDGRLY